ncbi:hypothetical protein AB5I41_17645 [Sphingomonas sp. MMS24-JH45]
MQAQYSAQQRKVLASRGAVAKAQELASDVQALRDQYAKTSARAAELQQQGETEEAGITSLGMAAIPTAPSFPRWPLIILGLAGCRGAGRAPGPALSAARTGACARSRTSNMATCRSMAVADRRHGGGAARWEPRLTAIAARLRANRALRCCRPTTRS